MKRTNTYLTAPLFIVVAAALWALDGIIRRSLYTLPPSVIVLYEHVIGTLFILPFFIPRMRNHRLTRREAGVIAIIALFSGVAGTIMFTAALQAVNYISFSVVFLLQKLQPVFAIASSYILLKEPIRKSYIKWAVLAVIAAYFVTFPTGTVNLNTGSGTVIAALLAFGAAAVWGSATSLSKMALAKMDSVTVAGWRFLFTIPMAFIAVFVLKGQQALLSPTPVQWLLFAAIALSTGMVGLVLYYKGLKHTRVQISTMLELTFPLLAIGIDAVMYHSFLSPVQWIGAIALMFAMYRIALLNAPAIDHA